jgi:MFS family permease
MNRNRSILMALTASQSKPRHPMAEVMAQRDFRLLWLGQTTSFLGDQFHMIAAPWLVLQMTNDPLALGAIMAVAGIPRVICMLFGGAIADRFSPRTIMLVTDILRLGLVSLLALLMLTNALQMWMLYAISLGIGAASGLFSPASGSIIPSLVSRKQIQPANSIFQGTAQLCQFLGPALAGGLIGWFAHRLSAASGQSNEGITVAFIVDAVSFLISVITLKLMSSGVSQADPAGENMLESIRDGVQYIWKERFLRLIFIMMAFANLFFAGPLLVGMPVLANSRLPEGALAFGMIMSAYAAGNLAGILGAGALPRPNANKMRWFLLVLLAGFGLGLASFGWISATWAAAAILVLLGVGNGYLAITLITLLQQRTPKHMVGRLMSLILVSNTGLVPLSQALSGALSRWSLEGLFATAGFLMVMLAIWTGLQPEMLQIGNLLASQTIGD